MLRIREVRRSKDITQVELAKQLGVSQSCVSDWECGQSDPTIETFIRLGQIFGCSLDYLAGLTDENIVTDVG